MINRVCVFAHYDKDNTVDEYVYYYLNELLTIVQKLVFVTVSDIPKKDVERLEELNIEVIKRENIGYDFYSYKVGIEQLDLNLYDELIVCNDSVFGPLFPMKKIFDKMNTEECDFWGITDSRLIAYHLQSYFLVFRKSILQSLTFSQFWKELKILEDKNEIIKRYEIGLSSTLIKNKFIAKSFVNNDIPLLRYYKDYRMSIEHKKYKYLRIIKTFGTFHFFWNFFQKKYNPSVTHWEYFVAHEQMPFIKKSLFTTDENKYIHKKKYEELRKMLLSYPTSLIINYIKNYE